MFILFTFSSRQGARQIAFNQKWVARHSLNAFASHEQHHNLTEEQYKEVWETCCKAEGVSIIEKHIGEPEVNGDPTEVEEKPKRRRKKDEE